MMNSIATRRKVELMLAIIAAIGSFVLALLAYIG